MNLTNLENNHVRQFNDALREFDAATLGKFGGCSVPEAIAVCESRAAIPGVDTKCWFRLALKLRDTAAGVGLPRAEFTAAPELPEPMDFEHERVFLDT